MKTLLIIVVVALAGCATAPDTKIKQPLSIRPAAPDIAVDNGGAIFQAGHARPRMSVALFEDQRAHQVGDTLTVNLVENMNAKRTSSTTDERKVSGNVSIPSPTLLGHSNIIGATSWSPAADNKLENTDNRGNANTISGTITVTVTEVLSNGNLNVAGEKQLSINSSSEYIRLAGVVNPRLISASNSINSTQIADAQFESKSTQSLDMAQVSTSLARFFLTLMPF